MKRKSITIIISGIMCFYHSGSLYVPLIDQMHPNQNFIKIAENQYGQLLDFIGDSLGHLRKLNEDGTTRLVKISDWTSGFRPGCLWYLYELTWETKWKKEAIRFTENMAEDQFKNINHDIGLK